MQKRTICLATALVSLMLLVGCGQAETVEEPVDVAPVSMEDAYIDVVEMVADELENEAAALSEVFVAAIPDIMEPVASGELVQENSKAIIDYSNTEDGYVMVCYTAETGRRLKAQVIGPKTTYTYNLTAGEWSVLPLTDGNGSYQFKIFENVSGSQYALAIAAKQTVELTDEFAPFLRPNQYVNYSVAENTVSKAAELSEDVKAPLEKVEVIYNYVVKNLTYDKDKARNVKSGYIPVLDTVLEEQKGICFDYAALMTGMLRSQGIPCKMVFGYAGTAYHAWISVWTAETGWVDGAIFFDGVNWQRIDPTFASSANQSEAIMAYIGNGKNYTEKYLY